MVLVKEDAVIVLWCSLAIILVKNWDLKNLNAGRFYRNLAGISLACLLVFIAGILWLKWMNHWEETRTGDVFKKLQTGSLGDVAGSFGYLLLQRLQFTVFVLVIVYVYAGWKYMLAAVVISIPLAIANFLAGELYATDDGTGIKNMFSLMWTPRLSMYWAYWLTVMTVAFTYRPSFFSTPSRRLRLTACMCFGAALFGFQIYFLFRCEVVRFDTFKSVSEAFEPAFPNEADWALAAAATIARQLPAHYPVAPMERVFGAFHKQDIVWLNRLDKAWRKPRMILVSYNTEDIPADLLSVMKHPLFMLYREKLQIYTEAEDTIYLSKAGIHGIWIDKTME